MLVLSIHFGGIDNCLGGGIFLGPRVPQGYKAAALAH